MGIENKTKNTKQRKLREQHDIMRELVKYESQVSAVWHQLPAGELMKKYLPNSAGMRKEKQFMQAKHKPHHSC